MKKRFLASLLTVVTTMSLFVGCKKTDSTTEEIITEKETNFLQKLIQNITNLFK